MTKELERPFSGVLADSVAGAAVGFAFGGPAGAAAGGLTPLGARLMRLSQEELSAEGARAEALWAIAAHEAELPRERLIEVAEGDADRRHMGYSAAAAAASSRYPARVVALGRALAAGLKSEQITRLDHWQLVIDAIAEIERPHLALLTTFVNVEGSPTAPVFVRRTLDWDQVIRLSGDYGPSLPSLLARLERLGLVHQETVAVYAGDDGRPGDDVRRGAFWRITDFGNALLDELWRAGASVTVVMT